MATKALEAARLERINAAALLTTMDIPAFGVIDLFPGVKTLVQDIRQLGSPLGDFLQRHLPN